MGFRLLRTSQLFFAWFLLLACSALAHAQQVTLTPGALTWGQFEVGQTSGNQTLTLTNHQSAPLSIAGIVLPLGADFIQPATTCPLGSGTNLAAGASCTISVAFRPLAPGLRTSEISVLDDAPDGRQSATLTGNAVVGPILFGPTLLTFTAPPNSVSVARTAILTNTTKSPVSLTGFTVSGPFAQTNNCAGSLAAGATCSFTITFQPTAVGFFSGAIAAAFNAGAGASTIDLYLAGSTPLSPVTLTPSSYDFGSVQMGQSSAPYIFTLTNGFTSPITISSVSTTLSDFAPQSNCPVSPATLAPNATCTISVTFTPSTTGLRSGALTVAHNAPGSPATASLTGTGKGSSPLGSVTFTPPGLTFPQTMVGATATAQIITINNNQNVPLTISNIVSGSEFPILKNNCPVGPATVAAQGACTLSIAFRPLAAGPRSSTLIVTDDGPNSPQKATLSGQGQTGSLVFTPSFLNFPQTPVNVTSAAMNATLSNTSTASVAISSISASGPPFAATNNCPASLAPNASCTVSVTFDPTSGGSFNGAVSVNGNSGPSLYLTGTGTNSSTPVIILPKSESLYFYSQLVGTTSAPQTVTIVNNQSVALTINSAASTADFPIQNGCGTTLAAKSSCDIQVSFDPQSVGRLYGSLVISANAAGSPFTVSLSGTGIQTSSPVTVSIAPMRPCVTLSGTQQFTATVTGTTNTAVNWYVNNTLGGNSSFGTISASGLYTAPATAGSPIIKAVSQDPSHAYNTTPVSVVSTPAFNIYPGSASLPENGQQTFQPQSCGGNPDTNPVTWTVDNIPGGSATVGTITSAGLYTAPASTGTHILIGTDTVTGQTAKATVTVTSGVWADFGSRNYTLYPISPDVFGFGRAESLHNSYDAGLLTSAGIVSGRLYAQIPVVYATPNPNWSVIDNTLSMLQSAGVHPILQMAFTPPWLQPNPNPCGQGSDRAVPTDLTQWAQIAASYVAHLDATFPGLVQDYEIWNEPDTAQLCTGGASRLTTYLAIYAAAAPLMKQQAAADKVTIRIGGPATATLSDGWVHSMVTSPSIAPYLDFISYHQYLQGTQDVNATWDTYNGDTPLYQATQAPWSGAFAEYHRASTDVAGGNTPLRANTPIYITEYNPNWAFIKDCCRNDPTYGPLWNALYITDLFDGVLMGANTVPARLVYFAGNAYPYFCLIGTLDANMDCNYPVGSNPQPYPPYFAYDLFGSPNYLGLSTAGGYMAWAVEPHPGQGGLAATAFYTPTLDAIVIVNPTSATFNQLPVGLYKTGFTTAQGTLYQIVNGNAINASSVALTPQSAGNFVTTVNIPPYSVQAIALTGQ